MRVLVKCINTHWGIRSPVNKETVSSICVVKDAKEARSVLKHDNPTSSVPKGTRGKRFECNATVYDYGHGNVYYLLYEDDTNINVNGRIMFKGAQR